MNDSNFTGLKYFPDQRLNVRQIENLDTKSILRGNVKDLLGVMNDLAYIDVENDEYVGGSAEGKKLYKLSQYGLQYMIYTVSKLGDNALLLRDYLQIQEDKRRKLMEVIHQQEETLRALRHKKKSYQENEKNYKTLLRTLNIDSNIEDMRDNRGKYASYDSEPEKREETVPLNLPRGPKRQSPKANVSNERSSRGIGTNTSAQNYYSQESNTADRDHLDRNTTSTYGNETTGAQAQRVDASQYTSNEPDRDLHRPDRNRELYNRQPVTYDPYTKYGEGTGNVGTNKLEQTPVQKKEEENKTVTGGGTKQTDQKTKRNEDEDEYEDDFELSESMAPDSMVKPQPRFGKSPYAQGTSDRKKDEPFVEETLSMDFDKEFNRNYLENLDRLVNKNKAGVEVPVKRFT